MLHGVREPLCALGKLMANTRWSVAIRPDSLASGSTPDVAPWAQPRSKLACSRRLGRPPDRRHGREEEDRDDEQARKEPSSGGLAVGQDSISHVSPARPNAQNANSANGAHSEPRVLARHRDDQTESLISRRSTPMASFAPGRAQRAGWVVLGVANEVAQSSLSPDTAPR